MGPQLRHQEPPLATPRVILGRPQRIKMAISVDRDAGLKNGVVRRTVLGNKPSFGESRNVESDLAPVGEAARFHEKGDVLRGQRHHVALALGKRVEMFQEEVQTLLRGHAHLTCRSLTCRTLSAQPRRRHLAMKAGNQC